MKYQSFALSDPGTVRKENQDAVFMDPRLGLFMVCDGCGGTRAGGLAGRLAVETVHQAIREEIETFRSYVKRPTVRKRIKALDAVISAVNAASERIHALARSEPDKAGMATTIALLQLLGSRAIVAHVGDSRIYLYRRGQLLRLTEDHTLAARLVRRGTLSPAEAQGSRAAQILTRSVGTHEIVHPDSLHFEVIPGDMFLLCSDGLTMHVGEKELAEACAKLAPDQLCRRLVAAANRRGGQDNISLVVVRTEPAASPAGDEVHRRLYCLQQVPLFRHLAFAELLRVLDICTPETYEPGNRIFAEGDRSDRLYVTVAGTVHVLKGKRKLAELPPGSLFGEMGLIDNSPRSADILAPEGARVLSIEREEFFALLRQERPLAVKVLWGLCFLLNQRLRTTSAKLSARAAAEQAARAHVESRSRSALDELAEIVRPFT